MFAGFANLHDDELDLEQLVVQSWSIPSEGVEFEFLQVVTVYFRDSGT